MRKSATGAPFPIRVAHASRLLANASRVRGLFSRACRVGKVRFGEAPKPARGTRALPGLPRNGFTLIELLVVMAVIIVLAGLILSTSGYVQKKGGRSRAEAEIAAMSAALESYKADNGVYPASATFSPADTDPSNYRPASLLLYRSISGDDDNDVSRLAELKTYFAFKPNQLGPSAPPDAKVDYIRDPFGNSYGYSTMKASNPAATAGYNPTFDLWSIAEGGAGPDQSKWIKNW